MTKNNNKSGEDAFGFLGALFGACMGEDRKESKKAPGLSKAFTNFSKVMIPDQKEVTVFKQDLQQLRESRLYADPDKGIASQISKVSEDISGQRPPGFLEKLLGFLTDPVSPYARPLDEKNRSKTIATFSGILIYLATSHILPEAHARHKSRWTLVSTIVGVLIMWGLVSQLEAVHVHGHETAIEHGDEHGD